MGRFCALLSRITKMGDAGAIAVRTE